MASRLEQLLYKNAHKIARRYSRLWDFKTAVSAGIVALDMLTAEQRERALAIVKGSDEELEEGDFIKIRKDEMTEYYKRLSKEGQESLQKFLDFVEEKNEEKNQGS